MGLKQTTPAVKPEDRNTFDCLRLKIDGVCSEIAKKFDLYDSRGRPRKAFILDALLRYACPGCVIKVLSQPHGRRDIDSIYGENHRLAVNLLTDRLRHRLSEEEFDVTVQDGVNGEYGTVDVVVEPSSHGVESEETDVIVEVKTGVSLSYSQLLRYLIERPNATLVVWRVTMRQVIVFDGRKMRMLLLDYIRAAIRRGLRIINEETPSCKHNPMSGRTYAIEDPQGLIEGFTSALMETLPKVIDAVLQTLKAREPARSGGDES